MTVQIDSREKPHAVQHIKDTFDKLAVRWFISKLPVGDYLSLDNARLTIDRKANLEELCINVCQQHDRFKAELVRANDLGIKLIFLVEHGPDITTLGDVRHWCNPRLAVSPYAMTGTELYKRLNTITTKYSTHFYFCKKSETGHKIVELLLPK